jgi:hypothetical protein
LKRFLARAIWRLWTERHQGIEAVPELLAG